MWHTIGILLVGAMDPAVVGTEPFSAGPPVSAGPPAAAMPAEMVGGPAYNQGPGMPGFQSGLMPGEQPVYAAEYAAMGNAPCYGPGASHTRPCSFDEYWDFTGQRSPTEYACWNGYGPDWCNTWNAKVEWLMWFTPVRQPELFVSTFDGIVGNAVVNPSSLGGENAIGNTMRNGARITLGRYLGESGVRAEGRFWGVEDGSDRFVVTSLDNQRLAIPRTDGFSGLDFFYLVSNPGTNGNGAVDVLAKRDLIGGDAWLRGNWWDDGVFRLDGLAGYQFLRMDDSIQLTTTTTVISTATVSTRDSFIANNEFHGASLGLVAEWRRQAIGLELLGKLGFGSMRERVLIDGASRTRAANGALTTSTNGLFTFPSNEGEYIENRFCVVPELNANFVIHMTPGWRIIAGYSLLFLNEVVVAVDQIDPRVNTAQPAGPALPAYLGRDTTIYIQGANLGLDFRW